MADVEIILTQDGSHSLYSHEYGVSYHSKYGAVKETFHVFIQAALYLKALTSKDIAILEVGFGTGLNAYMTYLEADKRKLSVKYTAFEAYPLSIDQAKQLNYSEVLDQSKSKNIFEKMHTCSWNKGFMISPFFYLEKRKAKFEEIDLINQFDIIYFDAFAPNAQPELWNEAIMKRMFASLRPDGVLVTYCAKGEVKRTLRKVGFKVENLPGPPGKREMTRALKVVDK